MKQYAKSEALDYLEFSRGYLENHRELYTKSGPHFNKSGYISVGSEIGLWLSEGGTKSL